MNAESDKTTISQPKISSAGLVTVVAAVVGAASGAIFSALMNSQFQANLLTTTQQQVETIAGSADKLSETIEETGVRLDEMVKVVEALNKNIGNISNTSEKMALTIQSAQPKVADSAISLSALATSLRHITPSMKGVQKKLHLLNAAMASLPVMAAGVLDNSSMGRRPPLLPAFPSGNVPNPSMWRYGQ